MGWNGSGAYVRLYSWQDDRDASIPITASRMDGEMDDMAAGIQACVAKNGENAATANLPMGGFRHTGVGNASARNHYAAAAQIQDNALAYAADSGAADAYVIALSPAITAYATGMRITVKIGAGNTNTGASTIDANGVGAKNIVTPDGSALVAGDLVAGRFYDIVYNGTSFELQRLKTLTSLAISSPATTGNAFSVAADSLTSGAAAYIYSNSSSIISRRLLDVHNDNASATSTLCVYVTQDAAEVAARIDQNGNEDALLIDTIATTGSSINVQNPGTTTGDVIKVSDAQSLTTGRIAYFYSNSSSTSARNLVEIVNDNANASSATCLKIKQDAVEPGLYVQGNVNTIVSLIENTDETNASAIQRIDCYRPGSSAYTFLGCLSDVNGTPDNEFIFRGDGEGFCDGSFTGGGADYAEYFEWLDGNPNGHDRRGISVVLDGNKIREATVNDDPLKVIGVISGNPSVVGDSAWNKWTGKHLRDDFGSYIMEDYEVWEWSAEVVEEPAVLGKRGKILKPAKMNEETYSFAFDAVPEGLEVPDDKKVTIQQRRVLNPDWDPSVEYIPREDRPEWDTVGLMGKLRVRKGQMVSPGWIKMRDISENVEEWLVR